MACSISNSLRKRMSVNAQLAAMTSALTGGYAPANKQVTPAPKPENKEQHTGFYCLRCKKQVYPSSSKVDKSKSKKNVMRASCTECAGPMCRFYKFSKA